MRRLKKEVHLAAGPIHVKQAERWAVLKTGELRLSRELKQTSAEKVGRKRQRLIERYRIERQHRIAVYEAAYAALKDHGIRGFAAGFLPLRVVAEGDSWFDYPGGGIIKPLQKRLGVKILNLAKAGDEVRFMLGVEERSQLERVLQSDTPFDVLLFSGGGNDVVDNPMCLWIKKWIAGQPSRAHLDATRFGGVLALVRAGYEDLIEIRNRVSPNTWLFIHPYDFPIPDGRGVCGYGPWLKPSLDYRGVPTMSEGRAIVRVMLEEFASMIRSIEAGASRVRFIKTQGILRDTQWANELHPTNEGFNVLVDVFYRAIKTEFPDRVR